VVVVVGPLPFPFSTLYRDSNSYEPQGIAALIRAYIYTHMGLGVVVTPMPNRKRVSLFPFTIFLSFVVAF